MCFGGGGPTYTVQEAVAPEVKYIGPSEADIQSQQAALEQYSATIQQQQSDFETSLQQQIAQANADTESLRGELAASLDGAQRRADASKKGAQAGAAAGIASAGSESAAQQVGAYSVSSQQSEELAPQTTEAVTEKKKPKKSLKISTAGTAQSAGSGLNIGV